MCVLKWTCHNTFVNSNDSRRMYDLHAIQQLLADHQHRHNVWSDRGNVSMFALELGAKPQGCPCNNVACLLLSAVTKLMSECCAIVL